MKAMMMAIVTAAVLAGGLASAAEDKDMGKPADGAAACTPRMGRLARRLGLSDDQVKKLHEANEARRKAVKPLREKLREELKSLRALVREDGGDAKIQASLDKVQTLRASIRTEREKFRKQAEAALTPSQRAKLLFAAAKKRRHARQAFLWARRLHARRGGWGSGGWR